MHGDGLPLALLPDLREAERPHGRPLAAVFGRGDKAVVFIQAVGVGAHEEGAGRGGADGEGLGIVQKAIVYRTEPVFLGVA